MAESSSKAKRESVASKPSSKAKSLWAKTPSPFFNTEWPEGSWLPLHKHMSDAVEIAKLLWERWVSESAKRTIDDDLKTAQTIFLFLATAHDLGKATPEFQSRNEILRRNVERSGLQFNQTSANKKIPHSISSQVILQDFLMGTENGFPKGVAETFGVVIGGHHGMSPSTGQLNDAVSFSNNTGFGDLEWVAVQRELTGYAIELSGIDLDAIKNLELSIPAQVVLTGLVIMADWLASDDELFPLESIEFPRNDASETYAETAWKILEFSPRWKPERVWSVLSAEEFFHSRFNASEMVEPRPLQVASLEISSNLRKPGIIVIEAPMGEGKTEAALMAAEVLAAKTGRSGLFFALPTQATTDGLFPRLLKWIGTLSNENHTITLAHGKAKFNEDYKGLANLSFGINVADEDSEGKSSFQNAIVHEWFRGRKKGILADFVVGTIDQVLMAALRQRHLALRHLGLADKVVVVDECHAYDAYMSQYLERALHWFGAYGVPVVILSATLPGQKRKAIVDAYLNKKPAVPASPWELPQAQDDKDIEDEWYNCRTYPLITYSDGEELFFKEVEASGRNTEISIEFLSKEDEVCLPQIIEKYLVNGGCAGVIRNTVRSACDTAIALEATFGEENVELYHAHFISSERIKKEEDLRRKLGPQGERPDKVVIVGTQVLEQSLDIDFDILITDIAPIDLLLQRMGRLFRHERNDRPEMLKEARCLVLGAWDDEVAPEFDRGSEVIYGRYLLEATFARLKSVSTIKLPTDIPALVQDVYQQEGPTIPEGWRQDIKAANNEHENQISCKISRAESFRIRRVDEAKTLIGWLSTSVGDSDSKGEASVRDTSDSLEVIVAQKTADGHIEMLPWVCENTTIPAGFVPDELAERLAGCTVNLPSIMCAPWMIDKVIEALEKKALPHIGGWQNSRWLKGALVLLLDEKYEAELCGYVVRYTRKWGLSAERVDTNDGREKV
ncbi:MAG: CRISPR-associated helicase Cas3' [Clostridiales bacterium]|nr:CRISPR-associated helicase Cas3' [Clostridiales bacterium]